MFLPIDCTVQDVEDATIEKIYNSFEKGPDGYSYEVIAEMVTQLLAAQLTPVGW